MDEKKHASTWDDLECAFDKQYVKDTLRFMKKTQLNLENGDMSITEYE